jgi:hypothetical protein
MNNGPTIVVAGTAEAFSEAWAPLAERLGVELVREAAPGPLRAQDTVAVILSCGGNEEEVIEFLHKAHRAGLETLKGGLWHPWRRKWATERKDMPLRDLAAAGGWRDPTTLLKCYQQPDEDTMRRVVLEAPKLLSRPVRRLEVTPTVTPGDAVDPSEDQRNAG